MAAMVEETGAIGLCSAAEYAVAEAATLKLVVLGEAPDDVLGGRSNIVSRTSVTMVVHNVDA